MPHSPNLRPKGDGHVNYCRNPDFDLKGPWCYTTDPSIRWERCEVEICPDESMLIYLTFAQERLYLRINILDEMHHGRKSSTSDIF